MASSLSSTCAICRLRLARQGPFQWKSSAMQVRGKKKNAKARTSIDVRLVKDVEGFGRTGSIVPVPIGQMRNYYFPQRMADYVPLKEAQKLKKAGFIAQRDVSFGRRKEDDAGAEMKDVKTSLLKLPARPTRQRQPVRIDLNLLEPQAAFDLLSRLLPPSIDFYRAPIPQQDAVAAGITPQPTSDPSDSEPSTSLYPERTTAIYGSVTTGDIATSVKALIAASEEAAGRIVIGDDDIRFIGEGDSRLKRLGDFQIEIKIKGSRDDVVRKVRILAEEDSPVDFQESNRAVDKLAAEQTIAGEPNESVLVTEAEVAEKLESIQSLITEAQTTMLDLRAKGKNAGETPAQLAERAAVDDAMSQSQAREARR